jgi:hypothetical protein
MTLEDQPVLFRSLEEIARFEPSIDGVQFGLPPLDKLTGGLRPGKLNIIGGYSHHGKTSLMMRAVNYNIDLGKKCLYISGDDTDDILLTKLIAMRENCSTEQVEDNGPQWRSDYVDLHLAPYLVLAAARDDYTPMDIQDIIESSYPWFNGESPDIICFDYVSILKVRSNGSGQYSDVQNAIYSLKKLIRDHRNSVWMVGHQCRKDAADVSALTLNHLEYGGHQQADGVIIGCRRGNMATMGDDELRDEQQCPKVWISVMKNKITGRKSSNPCGHPFLIDPVSGYIREILDSDRPIRGNAPRPTKVMFDD